MTHTPKHQSITLLLGLFLGLSGCTETYTTEVASEQEISTSRGNFYGNLNIGDQFGSAIANIGDIETDGVTDLAVGAPFDDDNGTNRGAVWVLLLDNDGKVDTYQKISSSEGGFEGALDDEDHFGSSIAELGDLNSDGFLDIAVGAPLDDDGGTDKGAIWILFLNGDGTVQSQQKISAKAGNFTGNLDANDQFGHSLANIGDLNNDGVTDLAVGMPYDDDGGTDRGAIWILFMNRDGTVDSTQKISSAKGNLERQPSNGDHFGSSITSLDDIDKDGVIDLAVGTSGDDDGGNDRGAVWILFMKSDGTVDAMRRITQTRGGFDGELHNGDQLGSSIANIGDINDDGNNDLAVGANLTDDGGTDRGAIWILFMQGDGQVISSSKISNTKGRFDVNLNDGDQFGGAIANIGDLDGDNHNDLAVGANLADSGGDDKGAFWVLFMKATDSHMDYSGGIFGGLQSPNHRPGQNATLTH
ncbi:MAG: integrin alpha [Candidatus Thiodiazotropha sp.]|jgi:hypothetical protein